MHMYPKYQGYQHGYNTQNLMYPQATTVRLQSQIDTVRGKVVPYTNSHDVFTGNEILEVSVNDTSRADAPSIVLGRQKTQLQPGQKFPIRFQFQYDKSRAGPDPHGCTMHARITDAYGRLLYTNDTSTPLKKNVKIYVKRV